MARRLTQEGRIRRVYEGLGARLREQGFTDHSYRVDSLEVRKHLGQPILLQLVDPNDSYSLSVSAHTKENILSLREGDVQFNLIYQDVGESGLVSQLKIETKDEWRKTHFSPSRRTLYMQRFRFYGTNGIEFSRPYPDKMFPSRIVRSLMRLVDSNHKKILGYQESPADSKE